MKPFVFITACLFLVSCASVQVDYDYDTTIDFSDYATYRYYDDLQTGLSGLDEKRLFGALDSVLSTKGLQYAEEADVLVDIKSGIERSQSNSTFGVGVGGTGRNMGGGINVGIPVGGSALKRTVEFNLVDAKRDHLIWQAVSVSPLREGDAPQVKARKLQVLVSKVFEKYPPAKK